MSGFGSPPPPPSDPAAAAARHRDALLEILGLAAAGCLITEDEHDHANGIFDRIHERAVEALPGDAEDKGGANGG